MKRLYCLIIILFSALAQAQEFNLDWNAGARLAGTTGEYMPFWARTGEDGILPVRSSGLMTAGAELSYKGAKGLEIETGANLVGALAMKSPLEDKVAYGMVDRLYLSGSWKMLHLDIGKKPRQKELGDLSITGGNLVLTGNARNLPGINAWSDWIYFEKWHVFGIKGNFAHYQLNDKRYIQDAMIHNKAVAVKFGWQDIVELEAGLDHWAQWGGVSPTLGQRPISFRDYIRIMFAQNGGEDATVSDQQNALGNHLGREYLRLNYNGSLFRLSLQYDMPYDDGKNIIQTQTFPDGVWSLKFSNNRRDAVVTDVIYEYIHTTWQSGDTHDRAATQEEMTKEYNRYVYRQDPDHHYYGRIVLGGRDNYFGNSEYRSGWTYFGRTLGLPLILPSAPNAEGMTIGIVNNRIRGHHFAIKGNICKVPYMFKSTYTSNWGTYGTSAGSFFGAHPKQLSLALEVELGKQVTNLPVTFAVGAYGDFGELYQDCAGLTLRVQYKGSRPIGKGF